MLIKYIRHEMLSDNEQVIFWKQFQGIYTLL